MKLAFNVDYDHRELTGIGRYGVELARSWLRNGMECEMWMLRSARPDPPSVPGARFRYYPWPKRLTDFVWPGARALLSGVRWVHSANGILLPGAQPFRQVAMVHDLGPILFGHMKADFDTLPWQARLRNVARRADCIVVNSRSTLDDLLNVFPEVEGRAFVTPLGIDHFEPGPSASSAEHILAVGTIEPRKNVDGLIRAYALLSGRRDVPPLVLAGMDGFRAEEFRKLPAELGIGSRVVFTGYITDSRLSGLFARSACLVHVAHHEGFGFTVPEAFNWGLPVVASDTAGLAEYFGGSAWMVDPGDLESIAAGIEKALDEGVTPGQAARRDELRDRLTWDACALKTRQVLESLSGRAGRRS